MADPLIPESANPLTGEPAAALIRLQGVHYTYDATTDRAIPALCGIDLEIAVGEHVAIVGANGSGKSTLARHLNGLLVPTTGDVWVQGLNTRDPAHTRTIRHTVAMVFQNPDNQIISTVVEEDTAFGPENLGLPRAELRARVDWALEVVGLSELRRRSPHNLSGGQKQRLALAGALAMQPACLVLDEATAMLDAAGRRAVHTIIAQLHQQGMTVVTITQNMAEAATAERVVALAAGQVAQQGPPHAVLTDEKRLRELGLDLPPMVQLARQLHARRPAFPLDLLTPTEMVTALQGGAP
jgi:energy-coupling factor transporter ATPase